MKVWCKFALVSFFIFIGILFFNAHCSFAETYITEHADVSTSTTWTVANSPYIIQGSVSINLNAVLDIEPGVVVKFEPGARMELRGDMNAIGTADNKIYFTSINDNSVGGNFSSSTDVLPSIGDYEGLHADGLSNKNDALNFSYVEFRYGQVGLAAGHRNANIENCKFMNNVTGIDYYGLSFSNSLTINKEFIVNNNIFDGNDKPFVFRLGKTKLAHLGNIFLNNKDFEGISVNGFIDHDSFEFTAGDSPYYLSGISSAINGSSIKIDAGASVEALDESMEDDSELNISNDSSLEMIGTTNSKIYFRGVNIFIGNGSLTMKNVVLGYKDYSDYLNGLDSRDGTDDLGFSLSSISSSDNIYIEDTDIQRGTLNIVNSNTVLKNVTFNQGDDIPNLDDGNIGLSVEDSNISGEGLKVKNYDYGILVSGTHNTFSLESSEIHNNNIGIYELNISDSYDTSTSTNSIMVSRGSFYDNNILPFYSELDGDVLQNLENNWWGNIRGPEFEKYIENPTSEYYILNYPPSDYIPWLTHDPFHPLEHNPVIIIPGIMSTELYRDFDDSKQLWPNIDELLRSFSDDFMNDLALDENGNERQDFPIKVGDIIREIVPPVGPASHVFDKLILKLESEGYKENTDLFVFPYDWRMSVNDDAVLLRNKIEDILKETGTNKIDIVAHSMGGLVAKKYISDSGKNNVDKVVFIGTPHLGAPKAFKALMYGDDMGINIGFISLLLPSRVKYISQNMPSVYDLLPSREYVDGKFGIKYLTDLVDTFITTSTSSALLNYDQAKDFMIRGGRNINLFGQAEDLHLATDNLDMSGVSVYDFVGCGTTKTIGSIVARKKKSWLSLWQKLIDDFQITYINGDGTVPQYSASLPYGKEFYVRNGTHAELPSITGVPEYVASILKGVGSTQEYSNISESSNACDVSGVVVSKHSPVDMNIYDLNGNHTGPTQNGGIEYGIPGVSYDIINETAYAFLPDGVSYKVVNTPTDVGSYDFYIQKVAGSDDIVSENFFNHVPIDNLNEKFEINIDPSNTYIMSEDVDGDGIFDKTISPTPYNNENNNNETAKVSTKNQSGGFYVLAQNILSSSTMSRNISLRDINLIDNYQSSSTLENVQTTKVYKRNIDIQNRPMADTVSVVKYDINVPNLLTTKVMVEGSSNSKHISGIVGLWGIVLLWIVGKFIIKV